MSEEDRKSALERLISIWSRDETIQNNITSWQVEDKKTGTFFDFPGNINEYLSEALFRMGISSLYSHQLEAWQAVRIGKNIVIVSGTASGKTLCYNLPVINELLENPTSCALYLFPTKSLTADQYHVLMEFNQNIPEESGRIPLGIYDGDTPSHSRSNIRKQARLLLTNPDMLHMAILPHHTIWHHFFRQLKFVVIDEIHTYRGVFGSHVANVIRRMKRISSFYGGSPIFILTSATIANPEDFACRLIDDQVTLINQNGAPHGKRHLIFFNPPVVNQELGIRRSATSEAVRLGNDLLRYGVQSIIFARARRTVELLFKDIITNYKARKGEIHAYRSGYLARERRLIEERLRSGITKMVIATSALELGIDIGGMDASIMVGYPGTIASTRQQAGRAGRRADTSVAILIATGNPIDQYLMRHPDFIMSNSPEKALINPDNLLILLHHLKCAAFELPFKQGEKYGSASTETIQSLLEVLCQAGILHSSSHCYHWMADQYPANSISLRTITEGYISLQAQRSDYSWFTVGEVDRASALWMVHPNAIYLHEGSEFSVEELDLENNIARMIEVDTDHYTEPRTQILVEKVATLHNKESHGVEIYYGEVLVTTKVIGYRRLKWFSREVLSEDILQLPDSRLQTMAYWLVIKEDTVQFLRQSGFWKSDQNYYGANWIVQRNSARKRDQFCCKECGAVEDGQAHHVHHIVPFRQFPSHEEANRLENLITLCPACHRRVENVVKMRSGLSGLKYVLQHIAPLSLMCDFSDLGAFSDPQSQIGDQMPAVVIYEQVPAGIGLCDQLYKSHDEVVQQAYDHVCQCECQDGCPACVGPAGEKGVGGKNETLALLSLLI